MGFRMPRDGISINEMMVVFASAIHNRWRGYVAKQIEAGAIEGAERERLEKYIVAFKDLPHSAQMDYLNIVTNEIMPSFYKLVFVEEGK